MDFDDALARARQIAKDAQGVEASTELTAPGAAGDAAVVAKRQAAQAKAAALRAQGEVEALAEAMRAEMEAKVRQMRALIAPLQEQVDQSNEVIWSMNLYLGRNEEIVRLTSGAPAPADTPIHLRQQVLSMDEETAAAAGHGGIDWRNLDVFDAWIAQPQNLARVLPEARGMVALVPRKRGRDYGDPWTNKKMNAENRWTYFLIRNGDNLYRMRTDFVVGKHLIPALDEFTGLFVRRGWDGQVEHLEPGTLAWDEAEKRQGARQRHYMRMAMILQGLVDRTAVFAPMVGRVNLLSGQAYESGQAVLVRDAEALLTDGRPGFYDWLATLNKKLRVGMRVMGVFNTDEFRHAGEEGRDGAHYYPNDRITPRSRNEYEADKPRTAHLYTLDGATTAPGLPLSGLTFKFERTKERWIRTTDERGRVTEELRAPKTRGTCTILPTDRFILPFDLVSVEDMRYYLNSRVNRHAYEQMMPLLHAAIEAKEAEAAAEAPFRALLAQMAAARFDVDTHTAEDEMPALVDWWKLGNRWHRPLVAGADPKAEAKATRMILDEYGKRLAAHRDADPDGEAAMVASLLAHDPSIMVIGRRRNGGYLAYAPQPRTYDAAVAAPDVWATEYTTTKTGRTITDRSWVLPGNRMNATRILHATDTWESWNLAATPGADLTDDEITSFANTLRTDVPTHLAKHPVQASNGWRNFGPKHNAGRILGITLDRDRREFTAWVLPDQDITCDPRPAAWSDIKQVTVIKYTVRWDLTGNRVPMVEAPGSRWGSVTTTNVSDTFITRAPGAPWDEKAGLVFTDPQTQADAEEWTKTVREHNAAVKTARDQVRRVAFGLEAAWQATAEANAKAEFIAEYGDESLWPTHAKSLSWRAPKPVENTARFEDSATTNHPVRYAIAVLLDQGVDLTGMTVAGALAKAGITDPIPDVLLPLTLTDPGTERRA